MEDLTGKTLGQYQITGPLGEGGMASVYKAYQPAMDRNGLNKRRKSSPNYNIHTSSQYTIMGRMMAIPIS
jgi:hypothetical protein